MPIPAWCDGGVLLMGVCSVRKVKARLAQALGWLNGVLGRAAQHKGSSTQLSSEMKMLAQNAAEPIHPETADQPGHQQQHQRIDDQQKQAVADTSVSGKVSTTSKGRTTALASSSSSAAITSAAVLSRTADP